MAARINADELSFAQGPLSYEFIETRITEKWRIRDMHDNAVGAAETEQEAKEAVDRLNGAWLRHTTEISG